jgi:hypothetical protein
MTTAPNPPPPAGMKKPPPPPPPSPKGNGMDVTSGVELAKALHENDWTASKSTDKTIAIMSALSELPWNKVKMLSLKWTSVSNEIVPLLQIAMHEPGVIAPPDGMVVEGDTDDSEKGTRKIVVDDV